MNPNPKTVRNPANDLDATLRLLATVPAPEDLTLRIHRELARAPRRNGWLRPLAGIEHFGFNSHGSFRAVAAAAIVCVVAGGGWQIFSRVQPAPAAQGVIAPVRLGAQGGFSTAGAVQTPDPAAPPPVITHAPVKQAPSVPEKKDKKNLGHAASGRPGIH